MRATKNAAGIASALFLCLLAADPAGAQPASSGPMPAPPASAAPPEDGQWTMPAKNFASTRYSELAEINTENVNNLQVAFTFSTGVNRGQESAPLVVGSTMYVLSPYPNILYALDLTQARRAAEVAVQPEARRGRAGRRLLRRGQPRPDLRRTARSSSPRSTRTRSRSNAETGEEVWKTKLGDINIGRDHDDGAARREGQGARRHLGRRIRRARLDPGARRQCRARASGRPTAPGRTRTC